MKSTLFRSAMIALIIAFLIPAFAAGLEKVGTRKAPSKEELVPGKLVSGSIDILENGTAFETFQFRVPADAFGARLTVSNSPADLDIFVKKGSSIKNYDQVDYSSTRDDYNESLFITRLSDQPLEDGLYTVDISYQRETKLVIDGVRSESISFNFVVELVSYDIKAVLFPGREFRHKLLPENGMAALFSFRVPDGSGAFRIDLFNTTADLDLMVGYEDMFITRARNDYLKESLLGRETLVVQGTRENPIKGGTYYILVFDQISNDHPVEFSIITGLSAAPSNSIMGIPGFPASGDEMQNVLMATVEIIGNAGKGSGCIVSSSGYILTNWHVIEDYTGEVSRDIYVAVNFANELPPVEMFKARMIDYSKENDLALLKITSGLYGESVPYSYTFPYFKLGDSDSLKIGQPLMYLGYPGIGGTGSRASISLTKGIVSGFESADGNLLVKTDAEINSGNSGGAAINTYYELLGIPTVTIEEDAGQLAFITPVSMIPESWIRYFK